MKVMFQWVTRFAVVLLVVYAASSFGMKFATFREMFARLFSTQSKIVCELLENKQIAELAVRKIKWRVTTTKESFTESLVVNTVYTLKFGFVLSEIDQRSIEVDDEKKIVVIPLPPVKLLSVDHFGDRKIVVAKKTAVGRIIGDAYDSGAADSDEEIGLKKDIEERNLINPYELANDFENALQPLWAAVGTYKLKVKTLEEKVDIAKMFEIYHKEK